MDSLGNMVNHVVQDEYKPYSEAKMPLIGDIGKYCSYCECRRGVDSLAVEHIEAKNVGGAEFSWDNFLLGCSVCNSVKGHHIVDGNCHWPHINNTFLSILYEQTGRVKVNPNIPPLSQRRAQKLIDLLHLNRHPKEEDLPSPKDFRWKNRYEAWNYAKRYKKLYLLNKIDVDDVLNFAKVKGNWSIWFTVFEGIDEVLARLISDFQGTCSDCFDASNHYAPIGRNPGGEDPV